MQVALSNSTRSRLSTTHGDAGSSKRRLPSVCVHLNGRIEMYMAHMLATESREKSFMGEGIPLQFCTQWIRHYMKNRAENGAQIHVHLHIIKSQ